MPRGWSVGIHKVSSTPTFRHHYSFHRLRGRVTPYSALLSRALNAHDLANASSARALRVHTLVNPLVRLSSHIRGPASACRVALVLIITVALIPRA